MNKNRGLFWIVTGLLLIAAALAIAGYNVWDERRAGNESEMVAGQLEELICLAQTEEIEISDNLPTLMPEPEYVLVPEMEMPVWELDGDKYIGILEIPAYGLRLPVMSQWSYPKLRSAPCRYYGSVYTDDLVIAAHNYRRHFGCLTNLREGDEIVFTDVQGNVFTYQVLFRETLMPYDVEKMTEGDWDLTLFTCTLGGSYRITVRCERIDK